MNLKCITLTGADDTISPLDLASISKDYPFVEWGILFSANKQGQNRYPSNSWLEKLDKSTNNFSAHLCGSYARNYLIGKDSISVDGFKRVQLNISPYLNDSLDILKNTLSKINQEYIIQSRDFHLEWATNLAKVSVLLDKSGGRGLFNIEDLLVKPNPNYPCGYAGGLSINNLAFVMEKVSEIAENHPIWFDMESSLRTDDVFDLKICVKILEIAGRFK